MKPRCWRRMESPPYTRREYIDGIPDPKIRKFTHGDPNRPFQYELVLVAKKSGQIRHNALEAARVAANKYLESKLGRTNYFFRVVPYPRHVLRENKMIFGAGADRLQDGMRLAFGKPVGTAAQVWEGSPVLLVRVDEPGIEIAKEALRRGASKLPLPCRLEIRKLVEAD